MASILILAAILRFAGLDSESLWSDEIDSVLTARRSISELLTAPTGNKQPLYFIALHFWTPIFGEGETSVRLPSAIMGVLTVAATYALGSLVGGKWTGLCAALLVAVSPVMLWYSQETRMYTLLSFLLVTSSFFLLKYLLAGGVRVLAVFAALTFLGLFTHYYYLPFAVAQGAAAAIWLWKEGRRQDLRYLVAAMALASSALLSRFEVALHDFQNVGSTSFTVPLSTLLMHLLGAIGLEQPRRTIAVWPATLAIWSALALGLAQAWLNRQREALLLAGTFIGAASLIVAGHAAIDLPILLRYFVPAVPIAYVMVAYGVSSATLLLGRRMAAKVKPRLVHATIAASTMALAAGVAGVAWADEFDSRSKQQWREVAAALEVEARQGDMLHVYPPRMQRLIDFYSPKAMTIVTRAPHSEPTCGNRRVWIVGVRRSGNDRAIKGLQDQGCPALRSNTFLGGISLSLVGAAPDALPGPAGATCAGPHVTIIGTSAAETLNGTPGDDVMHSLGGNDTVNGGRGNDVLCGGDGNDKLNGGPGDDTLLGEDGNDILNGGDGEDNLLGGPGDDVLNAGEGSDSLSGGPGRDQLRGGAGDWPDVLDGGPDEDALTGGGGADRLSGGDGADSFNGGAGNDECLDVSAEDSAISCEG